MKIALILIFFLLTSLGTTTPVQAQAGNQIHANAQTETYHSFLRINKVYVLYTDPIVPHRDKQGNFWVGLRPLALLIGARVPKDTSTKSVTVAFGKHTLMLTAGSVTATVNGKPRLLPAAAKQVGPRYQMVVPLAIITQAFHLKTQWNTHYQVMTLSDPDLLKKGAAGEFAGFVTQFEGPVSACQTQVQAFTGPPFSVLPIVPIALTHRGNHLIWTLKNSSARDYPQVDINTLVEGKSEEDRLQEGFSFPSNSFHEPIKTYPAHAHQTLNFGLITIGNHSQQSLDYIVTWIVP